MKNIKNTILGLSMLMGAQIALAMEQAPQRPISTQDTATLVGLPAEVKGYLLRFAVDGDLADMERGILIAAATSKSMLNDPRTMLEILNWVSQKVKYTAHAVQLAQRLQTRTTTLPVMQNKAVVDWITRTKGKLVFGRELYYASTTPRGHTNDVDLNLIKSYLKNPDIELDWQPDLKKESYKTAFMKVCHMNQLMYADEFLAAGASIDWYTRFSALQSDCPMMQFTIGKAYEKRKQKLVLKQPVKL